MSNAAVASQAASESTTTGTVRARKLGARWLICLIFPIEYLRTFEYLPHFQFEYAILSAIGFVACCLVLSVLHRPRQLMMPVWLLLFIFLAAYYEEFAEIIIYPWLMDYFPAAPVSIATSEQVYFDTFTSITIGFSSFCCVSWLYYAFRSARWWRRLLKRSPHAVGGTIEGEFKVSPGTAYLFAIPVLLVTLAAMFTGDMVMGTHRQTPLPYRIEGVVSYIGLFTVPMTLMLVIYAGIQKRSRGWVVVGVGTLVVYAVVQGLLRASKGTTIHAAFDLAFIWLTSGRTIRARQVMAALPIVVLAVVLYPMGAVYRDARLIQADMSSAVSAALTTSFGGGGYAESAGELYAMIFTRLSGTDVLLGIIERDPKPLGLAGTVREYKQRQHGFSEYVTFDIFDAPEELEIFQAFALAPSLLGVFYVIQWNLAIVIGVVLFTLGSILMWQALFRFRFHSLPVLQAGVLMIILEAAVEGGLDQVGFRMFPVVLISGVLVECVSRLIISRQRRDSLRPAMAGQPA